MEKILVGMSGGVDSAVAAALLKQRGYQVYGATLKLRDGGEDEDAARTADFLSIPHKTVDFRSAFKKRVIDYFISEYLSGRTPNPCVVCNRHVKMQALLETARAMGITRIATGHYARIKVIDGEKYIARGRNLQKDQSYFLYNITREQLYSLRFPLGELSKQEVRELAQSYGISVSKKPDSQEICFLPDGKYSEFIKENVKDLPGGGYIVDEMGAPVGIHKGIYNYTIGQRKGLGAFGRPVFVTGIDASQNTVTIGGEIFGKSLVLDSFTTPNGKVLKLPMELDVRIRYRAKEARAVVSGGESGMKIDFLEPQRAITPGQSAVLYDGEVLLGGGTIQSCGQRQ